MNAQELMRYLEKPENLTAQSVRDLDVLVEDFPYFHAARLAHLKALQATGNYRQSEYLSKAAAYLPDRAVLKSWLEGAEEEAVPLQFLHPEPVIEPEKKAVEPVEEELEVVEEVIHLPEAPPEVEMAEEPMVEEEPAIVVAPPQATPIAPAKPQVDEDWDSLDPVAKARRILEKNRAIRAALEGRTLEPPTPAPPAKVEEKEMVSARPEPEVAPALPQEAEPQPMEAMPQPEATPTPAPERVPERKPHLATPGKMTFAEWLQAGRQQAPAQREEPAQVPQESAPVQEAPAVASKEEIIDRFLQAQPKIQPKKEPVAAPQVPMPTSGSMLVTETLAKLYQDQGHLQLAEEAYEILKLKYPEKSSFFAARIREIKALQKN